MSNIHPTLSDGASRFNSSVYYRWRKQFFEGAKNGLLGNNTDRALEREIDELKRMNGDQAMAINAFKKNLKM